MIELQELYIPMSGQEFCEPGFSVGQSQKHQLFYLFREIQGQYSTRFLSDFVAKGIEQSYGRFVEDPDVTMPFFYNPSLAPEQNALVNCLHGLQEKLLRFYEIERVPLLHQSALEGAVVMRSEQGRIYCVSWGLGQSYYLRDQKLNPLCLAQDLGTASTEHSKPLSASLFGHSKLLRFNYASFLPQKGDVVVLSHSLLESELLDQITHQRPRTSFRNFQDNAIPIVMIGL